MKGGGVIVQRIVRHVKVCVPCHAIRYIMGCIALYSLPLMLAGTMPFSTTASSARTF